MKILIVGNSSVIGQAFATALKPYGEICMAGRKNADIFFDLAECNKTPETDEKFDVVLHVAGDFGGCTDDDFVRAETVNAVGTLSACRLAHHVQAKHFVLLSSIFANYHNDDPFYGIYALSKRHGEEVAKFFCSERNIDLTILRPSQVYDDAGACRKHQALLYVMADRAEAGDEINVFGTHDARRNYIYLDDLAQICRRVIQQSFTGTYICAHPQSVTLSEMANAAFAAFGKEVKIKFLSEKPNLSDLPPLNLDGLYQQIDYWPTVNINEGFIRIKQYREINF